MNAAAIQRPNPPFSVRSLYGRTAAVRREPHSRDALRSNGFGGARADINQVVAGTVSGFNANRQQLFAVRKPASNTVDDGVSGERPGLSGSGRHQVQGSTLG